MREIKFRAWDKRRSIYGNVVSIDMDDSDWFKERHAGHSGRVSLENPKNEHDCGSWGSWIEFVDLEQFTGLHDKNGEEIYEGDVVQDSTGLCLVTWNPIFACFCLRRDGWMFDHFFGEAVDPFDCEVIGNIHENPELLNAH